MTDLPSRGRSAAAGPAAGWAAAGDRGVESTRPGPLGVLDVMALLEADVGGPVAGPTAASVHRATGGWPEAVRALSRRAAAAGTLRRDRWGRWTIVPEPGSAPADGSGPGRRPAVALWRHGVRVTRRAAQSTLDRALEAFLTSGRTDEIERVVRVLAATVPATTRVGVGLAALRASLLSSGDRVGDAVAASGSLPLDRAETVAVRVVALLRAGRPVDAVRTAHRALAADLPPAEHGTLWDSAYGFAPVAAAYAGGLPEARLRARQEYGRALVLDRRAAAAVWAHCLGVVEQLAGDTRASLAALHDAAGLLDESPFAGGPAGQAISLVALAGSQLAGGDPGRARLTLTRAERIGPAVSRLSAIGILRGLLAHAEGDVDGARALLRDSGRRSVASGALLDATWAYGYLATLGRAGEAARELDDVGDQLQGPVLRGMHEAVRAAAARSLPGLDAAARRFADLGMHGVEDAVLGVRWGICEPDARAGGPWRATWPAGARLAVTPGRDRRGAGVAAAPSDPEAPDPEPPDPGERKPLSRRQLQVASLAADGLSNQEVADTLGLSRRTAEVHLQVAYAKLGVHDRRTLAARRDELLGRRREGHPEGR